MCAGSEARGVGTGRSKCMRAWQPVDDARAAAWATLEMKFAAHLVRSLNVSALLYKTLDHRLQLRARRAVQWIVPLRARCGERLERRQGEAGRCVRGRRRDCVRTRARVWVFCDEAMR